MKTTKKRKTEGSLVWLMTRGLQAEPRMRRLNWGRLARIYDSRRADHAVRRAIEGEAGRCGYTPATILSLNHWN
jgi:hypothetical protein